MNATKLQAHNHCFAYEFGLILMKKIKHQLYDLFERTILQNEKLSNMDQSITYSKDQSNSNPQTMEYRFRPFSLIDPLVLLESSLFQKYQLELTQLIESFRGQSQDQQSGQMETQRYFVDSEVQVSPKEIQESLLEAYSSTQQQQYSNLCESPVKNCRCQYGSESQQKSKQSENGQRELQLLIREKQTNKKIIELSQELIRLTQELQNTKLRLQSKSSQILGLKKQLHFKGKSISELSKQVESLKAMMEEQSLIRLRGEKVKSLKGKIEIESMRREVFLERERDSMELMIEKENMHSNQQAYSQLSSKMLNPNFRRVSSKLKIKDKMGDQYEEKMAINQQMSENRSKISDSIDE